MISTISDLRMWLRLAVGVLICGATFTVANEEVRAHVGDTVALPCRVDTTQCGELHSVKWYRDASRIYVFSQVGGIARAEGDATERMSVEYAPNGAEALLKISSVEVLDEASYKCEITYLEVRENCDVVQIVRLTTLVRPESVRILGIDGVSMGNASMLGPHNEGTKVEIICEAIGGRPIPKVTWYNDSQELDGLYSSHDNGDGLGSGTSKLQIKLSRGDLGAKLECKVESMALDEPIVSWMMIDVNVRPTKLELTGFKEHVVQGSNVLLNCDIFGARPAADVRWYNGTTEITTVESYPEETRDGTFTTKSSLTFVANRWHNGNAIHCYAENSVKRDLNEPSLHDLVLIEVFYPPVVTVRPTNITTNETGDLLLLCEYIANPMKLDNVIWSKDGKNLTLSNDKYYGGTWDNPPLTIKNISRDDLGEYACIAKNIVGSQESEDTIYLNVLYPPSVEVIMVPAYPVKAKDKENVTMQCSAIVGNPPELFKVRWFLGGQLLKELPECNYTNQDEFGNVEGSGGQLCDEFDPEIMSLLRVTEDFAGNYTCQATNVAGWGPVSEPQELVVYYAPSPAKLRYTPNRVIKGGSVTLECSVQHPGRPENVSYVWYRGSYAMHEITTSNWTVSPVLLETKSNFTCMAVNEGGIGDVASVFIDVSAPPSFIQNLAPYQGVLMNSKNISLTCRVECSPLCSITWFKDGKLMNIHKNPLYYVKTAKFPPDFRKNDFESIESVLVWNMTAWDGEQLDRTAPNSNYTCQSSANGIGPGVNSTIEIAVDYPPENLTVSNKVISVVENHRPERVFCSGKGHPALTYSWRRDGGGADVLSKTHILNLGAMSRTGSGKYVCEAANRHGTETISAYLNVQFAPGCTIETMDLDGVAALECTAIANPQEVTFTWKVKGENDTVEGAALVAKGLKGYLKLDATVDSFRTYQCYVNNSVGVSSPCERDVTGVAPWWKQLTNDNTLIILIIIIAIVICVIIVCIIIIIICRRRRANSKSPNLSSIPDKGTLGSAPPGGNSADPTTDPDNKGFYENLPFHGMQNPPDKQPIAVISSNAQPTKAGLALHEQLTSTNKLNHFEPPLFAYPKSSFTAKRVQRHQSFHGFQNAQFGQNMAAYRYPFPPYLYPMAHHFSAQNLYNPHTNPFWNPSFYYNLPKTCQQAAIRTNPQANPFNYYHRVQSHNNLYHPIPNVFYPFYPNCTLPSSDRIVGGSEFDIRRSASGINVATTSDTCRGNKLRKCESERRFNSLDLKKHKCYSPTFYSMRCKKHAKKQPVIYAVPKKVLLNLSVEKLERLANDEAIPKPKPRCKKHRNEIVYANVSKSLSADKPEVTIVQADVHPTNASPKSPLDIFTFAPMSSFKPFEPRRISLDPNKPSVCELTPKSAALVSQLSPLTSIHRQVPNLKVAPTVKVNPNVVVSISSSPQVAKSPPKGALNQQLQAKLKASPLLSNSSKNSKEDLKEDIKSNSLSNDTTNENDTPLIPMNILEVSKPQSLLHASPNSKNAFYTLTTPHLKQLTAGHNLTQHYTASNQLLLQQQQQYLQQQQREYQQQAYHQQQQYSTLPHSIPMGNKHMQKLLPRALFTDQYQQQQQQASAQGQPLGKSKSFCGKTAKSSNKKHFQIPLQKCHSFKFQTAESYFQPIKNIHEEHYMRNGYVSDLGPNYPGCKATTQASGQTKKRKNKHPRQHKHLRHTDSAEGGDPVQLQHPKPLMAASKKPNGVVYADLDMSPGPGTPNKNGTANQGTLKQQIADGDPNSAKQKKSKTEYATLKFNDVGQEIDV